MKRLVTLLLSVLLALAMCFSVIACGDDTDNKNTDPNTPGIDTPDGDDPNDTPIISPEIVNKAAAAVRKLYESDSYDATFELALGSKEGDDKTYAYSLEKRGSKLAVTKAGDATSYIFDVQTGYLYVGGAQTGYVAMSVVPSDTLGYFSYVLKQYSEEYVPTEGEGEGDVGSGTDVSQPAPAMPDVSAQYDEATKTLTVSVDAAKYVNDSLEPLYDAYKKNKTILALLDDYVKSSTNNLYSFTMLYESLFLMAEANTEATFDQANNALKAIDPELDLYELVGEVVELTDDLRATIASRTLGEMLSGMYDYITALIAAPPTNVDFGSIAQGFIAAALIDETEASAEKTAQIKAAMDVLLSRSIKNILNSALADNPEALAFISSCVTFQTLKSDMALTFDADDNIASITAACELKHSYTGETDGFRFLSDNEYTLDLAIEFSQYSDTHEDFEGNIAAVRGDSRNAIIYGEITDDVTVYIETAGENMPNVASVAYVYVARSEDEEDDVHTAQTAVVTVDNAASSVAIDAEFINEVLSGANGAGVRIIVVFDNETSLQVVYADENDVKDIAMEIIMTIMQNVR